MKLVEIKNLKKYYGSVKAVDDISFDIDKGSLFAFLGVNGAGKSTTINILANSLDKDSGTVLIDGYDLDTDSRAIRERIGIVFQRSACDNMLTVKENLEVKGSMYGMTKAMLDKRIAELSSLLELDNLLNRSFAKLSGGQKRRVDIARGLINHPKLLFLDEPTTGLDPKNRRAVWKIIDDLCKQDEMTVFLTTHYMEEAETADKVVIIDSGRIIDTGTPRYLKNKYSGDFLKIYSEKNIELEKILEETKHKYIFEDACYKTTMSDCVDARAFISQYGEYMSDFEFIKGNMDDVFLNATGKVLGDL